MHMSRHLLERRIVIRPGARGFTLIEMMIVVVIISVLAAVALPAYFGSMRKSRRAEAVAELSAIQQAQERWRANNTSYSANFGTAGLNLRTSGATVTSYTTPNNLYTMTLSAASVAGYTATATAVSASSQSKDAGCTVIQAVVTNGAASNTPTSCWSR